ncbi:hypothetical protein MMC29_001257 [Sticta canariensis]|nr:hypothetical protein [Sticta canariensis]
MTEVSIALLPYHKPAIVTILVQTSFVIALNVINYVLDHAIYCGLLGQILVGVAWGSPGAEWLGKEVQEAVVQVGYLGLVLLVYEDRRAFNVVCLFEGKPTALDGYCLDRCWAANRILILSPSPCDATPLQAFTAGAALCSTSLGTTFTILGTTGLLQTRIGTVLTSATMLDDVVALVLVEVISHLGSSESTSRVLAVVRPIAVSFGLVIILLLCGRFIVKPGIKNGWQDTTSSPFLRCLSHDHAAFISHTLVLFGFVAGATYAGTSGLFAAYLAGLSLSWCDLELSIASTVGGRPTSLEETNDASRRGSIMLSTSTNSMQRDERHEVATDVASLQSIGTKESFPTEQSSPPPGAGRRTSNPAQPTGLWIYDRYCSVVVERILKPFFFVRFVSSLILHPFAKTRQASIGFSIPIRQLFGGDVIWRGLVYTILMLWGKLLTGLWMVRIAKRPGFLSDDLTLERQISPRSTRSNRSNQPPPVAVPRSLYPASVLGTAMITRGEIGFLIASLAESRGIFASTTSNERGGSSRIYLVVIWAITLCTIIGPITMGSIVRRVKKLQLRHEASGGPDPLGTWGV